MPDLDMPYVDKILAHLQGDSDSGLAAAYQRHLHWGCYEDPSSQDASVEGYLKAAEEMTHRVCEAAGVTDGTRILDVGCGFGGTIDYLNDRLSGCDLVGLNIDIRQLERARDLVKPKYGNSVSFLAGDATQLPLVGDSFDVVLAIECAFHFPSRRRFLREAARVACPGGSLSMTDFMRGSDALADMVKWHESGGQGDPNAFYGTNAQSITSRTYERMARAAGLVPHLDENITPNTLPTYRSLQNLYGDAGLPDGVVASQFLEEVARRGFIEYHLIAFTAAG